jgi:hypothetical protein
VFLFALTDVRTLKLLRRSRNPDEWMCCGVTMDRAHWDGKVGMTDEEYVKAGAYTFRGQSLIGGCRSHLRGGTLRSGRRTTRTSPVRMISAAVGLRLRVPLVGCGVLLFFPDFVMASPPWIVSDPIVEADSIFLLCWLPRILCSLRLPFVSPSLVRISFRLYRSTPPSSCFVSHILVV